MGPELPVAAALRHAEGVKQEVREACDHYHAFRRNHGKLLAVEAAAAHEEKSAGVRERYADLERIKLSRANAGRSPEAAKAGRD